MNATWMAVALLLAPGELISNRAADAEIRIVDTRTAADGALDATLENTTAGVMKDVKLLVTHTWHWKDERHPGTDNPGRSTYVTAAGEIPPHGTLPFRYRPDPPLPVRSDGWFETGIRLQSFTQVGD